MALELDCYCNPNPLDITMPEDEASPEHQFLVTIEATHLYLVEPTDEDEDINGFDQLVNIESVDETLEQTFTVKREDMLHESTSRFTISNMLFAMRVPLDIQDFMVRRIWGCARAMAKEKHNTIRKVLRMCVFIGVTQCVEELPDLEVPMEYSMDDDDDDRVHGLVAATKSSIEGLEKVKVEESSRGTCTVCLEELVIDSEATRMPCLHLFHEKCIVNWLEKSNFCPLCRFKLPGRE